MNHRLLILGWHNVESTWCFPAPAGEGPRGLYQQLDLLRRFATVVDLRTAVDDLAAGRRLPARSVALTFDDGYRDNLTLAMPMLRELGLPATFFLVPSVLDGSLDPWWETLGVAFSKTQRDSLEWDGAIWPLAPATWRPTYDQIATRLKRLDQADRRAAVDELVDRLHPGAAAPVRECFLDWDGARELVRQGGSVGAHSFDHAILANERPEEQQRNLSDARVSLERELGTSVEMLAYPNGMHGDFNDDTVEAADHAGYRCAVTTIPGWNSGATPPYELRRQVMYPEFGFRGFKPLVKPGLRAIRSEVRGGS